MFKRPGVKIANFAKAMFWLLSIVYVFADLAIAGVLSVVIIGGSKVLLGFGNYMKWLSAIKFSLDLVPGVAAGITIVIWLVALVSIPLVIMLLYQGALVLLMFANTSRDLEACKESLRRLEATSPAAPRVAYPVAAPAQAPVQAAPAQPAVAQPQPRV